MFEQGKVYTAVIVNALHVSRNGEAFDINLSFFSAGNTVDLNLLGVRDTSNIHELLSAEKLWIEAKKDSQLEFGRYSVGISHEYFTEISFDDLGSVS
jgi:hypothetical protein